MKKLLYSSIILCTLISCSKKKNAPVPILNSAPPIPSLIFPSDKLICTGNDLQFQWGASVDPDGDAVSYEVSIARDEQFSDIVSSDTTTETSRNYDLEKGTSYYWRVKAVDSEDNESAVTATWNFITEAEASVNTLPSIPSLVAPETGSTLTASLALLEWNATDADGDALLYDIYFGETNPPALLEANVNATTYEADIIAAAKYYWRVVVKDSNGAGTIGQVWSFTVE